MRVIAGQLRGRPIAVPSKGTRPTTDMVRGAIANSLVSLDAIDGARVADLYAGSGAMGIELLSRGAAHCTFVERAPDAVRVIRANLVKLGLADRSTVLAADAVSALRIARRGRPRDRRSALRVRRVGRTARRARRPASRCWRATPRSSRPRGGGSASTRSTAGPMFRSSCEYRDAPDGDGCSVPEASIRCTSATSM